jgi:hypothetical protein
MGSVRACVMLFGSCLKSAASESGAPNESTWFGSSATLSQTEEVLPSADVTVTVSVSTRT